MKTLLGRFYAELLETRVIWGCVTLGCATGEQCAGVYPARFARCGCRPKPRRTEREHPVRLSRFRVCCILQV